MVKLYKDQMISVNYDIDNPMIDDLIKNYSANTWDMNITFRSLVESNPTCKVNRYMDISNDRKYTYDIYMTHPQDINLEVYCKIKISKHGFIYCGDVPREALWDIESENTMDALKEAYLNKRI